MRKLVLVLVTSFLMLCILSTNAQDLVQLDNMTVVNDEINNVTIQLDVTSQQQDFSNRINQSNVNQKSDFNIQLNADNTVLTLNFTRSFNEVELETLFEYCGFELDDDKIAQLQRIFK